MINSKDEIPPDGLAQRLNVLLILNDVGVKDRPTIIEAKCNGEANDERLPQRKNSVLLVIKNYVVPCSSPVGFSFSAIR